MPEESVKPYLIAAVYCESILHEQEGNSLSVIRILDRISIDPSLDPALLDEEKVKEGKFPQIQLFVLVKFASINYSAIRKIRLTLESPDGTKKEALTAPLVFETEKMGMQVRIRLAITIKRGGRYWLHVNLDDEFFTRIPLEVNFQKIESEPQKKE